MKQHLVSAEASVCCDGDGPGGSRGVVGFVGAAAAVGSDGIIVGLGVGADSVLVG